MTESTTRRVGARYLIPAARPSDDESDISESVMQHLLPGTPHLDEPSSHPKVVSGRRSFFIRSLALVCAMSLSIGSHYAQHMLGPLKSRLSRELGTDNTEFSLLISAFSLNSTWTPLLGGIIASRLGTTYTSIMATGVIFLGQALLLVGDLTKDVRLMTVGMFVFGIGTSPLSVVQETIIVRFFKSHGLGISLAIGLIAGKGASFVSAATSYRLTQHFGSHAPFFVATSLTGLSVAINLVYVSASKWLIEGAGAELEASDIRTEAQQRSLHNLSEAQALEKVAEKHRVSFRDITHLGDVFWAYLGLNVLCGAIWAPFVHLSANLIEQRYGLTELDAATQASYLLAGSVILYPICGYVVDTLKHRPIVLQLLLASSCLTLACYFWLALPPRLTQTAIPAIISYGTGYGFSPLLLVVIVPQIVPLKFVSTALGAHKSIEHAGGTLFQTFAGWLLDTTKVPSRKTPDAPSLGHSTQLLLNTFLFLNILQMFGVLGLSWLDRRHKMQASRRHHRLLNPEGSTWPDGDLDNSLILGRHSEDEGWTDDTTPDDQVITGIPLDTSERSPLWERPPVTSRSEISRHASRKVRRGEVCGLLCCALIICTWALFFGTAVLRLRSKDDRGLAHNSTLHTS